VSHGSRTSEKIVTVSDEPSLSNLPLAPPIEPMLAKLARAVPTGEGWWYEPKWDGFRCLVFRDGDEVYLQSRNLRPLNRYFPEVAAALAPALPLRCVVDGEIVVANPEGGLSFDSLTQRIHPAASRVNILAEQTPASFVAFDVLAFDDDRVLDRPFEQRRAMLHDIVTTAADVHVTPASDDPDQAQRWFADFEGAGLDGIVAKRGEDPYVPGKRTLVKVKHERTAECVVAGFRVHKDGNGVGSLLLGLFDDEGTLHHVGVCAGFSVKFRTELLSEIEPLREPALDDHPWRGWAEAEAASEGHMPGAVSRWNAGKNLSWHPLRCQRVLEVTFGQLESGRFRHGVRFVRWRPDREPASCTYDQLDVASPVDFAEFVGST